MRDMVVGFDISIPTAAKHLRQFFDYLVESGHMDADACVKAKKLMQEKTAEWVQQERDYLDMDYDEYNEKYWGF